MKRRSLLQMLATLPAFFAFRARASVSADKRLDSLVAEIYQCANEAGYVACSLHFSRESGDQHSSEWGREFEDILDNRRRAAAVLARYEALDGSQIVSFTLTPRQDLPGWFDAMVIPLHPDETRHGASGPSRDEALAYALEMLRVQKK